MELYRKILKGTCVALLTIFATSIAITENRVDRKEVKSLAPQALVKAAGEDFVLDKNDKAKLLNGFGFEGPLDEYDLERKLEIVPSPNKNKAHISLKNSWGEDVVSYEITLEQLGEYVHGPGYTAPTS